MPKKTKKSDEPKTRRYVLTLEVETNLTLRELRSGPKLTTTAEGKLLRVLQVQANAIRADDRSSR